MNINPIKSEADYDQTLAEIYALFESAPDTPEGDRLEILITLVEAYEKIHYPIGLPDPIAAIEYHLDSRGLKEEVLDELLGGRSHAAAVMAGREPLTIDMIRRLYQNFGIPVDILMQSMIQEWDKPVSDTPVSGYEYAEPTRELQLISS